MSFIAFPALFSAPSEAATAATLRAPEGHDGHGPLEHPVALTVK